jgi:hypothetical protein
MLEEAIKENTAVLREVLAALQAGTVITGSTYTKEQAKPFPTKEQFEAKIKAGPPKTEPAPEVELVPDVVDYEKDVLPAFKELIKTKGAAAAQACLSKVGAQKLSLVAVDSLPTVFAAIKSAMVA